MAKAIIFYASKKIFKHWSVGHEISQDEIEHYKPVYHISEENPSRIFYKLNTMGQNHLFSKENQEYIRKHGIGHTSMSIGDLIYYYELDLLLVVAKDGEFLELPKELRNTHMKAIQLVKENDKSLAGD